MNPSASNYLYEDENIKVSKNCIIFKGQKILAKDIKKIHRELQTFEGLSWGILNRGYTALILDMGGFRKNVCVFRELVAGDVCDACLMLPNFHWLRKHWTAEQKKFLRSLSYGRKKRLVSIEDLRNVPGTDGWIDLVENAINNNKVCDQLEEAILLAMS